MSIRSPINSWVVALALTGCASLIELERTQLDLDGDQIEDTRDNCANDSNPNQEDVDGDDIGDACDECPDPIARDLDGDGRDDGCDGCVGSGVTSLDVDGDGVDDGCDACIFEGTFEAYSPLAVDDDNDGITDGCDTCIGQVGVDIDRDGIDDVCDSCLNGPPSDQDHDLVEDGCDNCPVEPNVDQQNDGGEDELGTACDPPDANQLEHSRDARVVFDGFYALSPDQWEFPFGTEPLAPHDWQFVKTASGDQLHQVVTTTSFELVMQQWLTRINVYGAYSIRMRGWFDDPGQSGGELGVVVSTFGGTTSGPTKPFDPPTIDTVFAQCSVSRAGVLTLAGWVGASSPPISMPGVATTAPMTIRLAAAYNDLSICVATCEVVEQPETTISTGAFPELCSSFTVGLTMKNDATTSLDWIEAVLRTKDRVTPSFPKR